MEKVALHRRALGKPTLWKRVLTVNRLSYFAVILIDARIFHRVFHITIHVDEIASFGIGVGIGVFKKILVRDYSRIGGNDRAELRKECLLLLSLGFLIIIRRLLRCLTSKSRQQQKPKNKCNTFHCYPDNEDFK